MGSLIGDYVRHHYAPILDCRQPIAGRLCAGVRWLITVAPESIQSFLYELNSSLITSRSQLEDDGVPTVADRCGYNYLQQQMDDAQRVPDLEFSYQGTLENGY